MKPFTSVIIPAYNEEGNIRNTVDAVLKALYENTVERYELIIVNDCSTDGTGRVIDEMASSKPFIKPVHNKHNMGSGASVQKGYLLAQGEYAAYIPGDNEITPIAIHNMFAALGTADIINTYIVNMDVRPFMRRVLSRSFSACMRILFGIPLRYFTGPTVIRTKPLKHMSYTTGGFAFMMEILVQLVKAGYSYVEVPMPLQRRTYGKAKVYRLKDMWRVLKSIFTVWYVVYCTGAVRNLRQVRAGNSF